MKVIRPSAAWRSSAPYSPAVRSGPFIFVSGCVAIDLDTGASVSGDIAVQTVACIDNVERILAAAGASLTDVVKTTVFLIDASDLPGMNDAYRTRFGDHEPARSTVVVSGLGRPEFRIEIDAIARSADITPSPIG